MLATEHVAEDLIIMVVAILTFGTQESTVKLWLYCIL